MKVLILGGNGMLGPWVIKSLEGRHELRITDINDLDTHHEYVKLDVSSLDGVVEAAEGMNAIINLSVLRPHRQIVKIFLKLSRSVTGSSRIESTNYPGSGRAMCAVGREHSVESS